MYPSDLLAEVRPRPDADTLTANRNGPPIQRQPMLHLAARTQYPRADWESADDSACGNAPGDNRAGAGVASATALSAPDPAAAQIDDGLVVQLKLPRSTAWTQLRRSPPQPAGALMIFPERPQRRDGDRRNKPGQPNAAMTNVRRGTRRRSYQPARC